MVIPYDIPNLGYGDGYPDSVQRAPEVQPTFSARPFRLFEFETPL